ncbi:hypothetical protein APLC1_1526 [Limnospira platensis C1]|nr:hypothetical protein APLC1_1526 [Arthrospira platensis C1]
MAFADIREISKKRIGKFLELLRQQPSMFADCTPETWAELDQNLAQFEDEDYKKISGAILAWVDKHHYANSGVGVKKPGFSLPLFFFTKI